MKTPNMKNMSTPKSNKIQSPKTPGGISKTLLTPCRRLGLSRNWKRSGSSPFISPLVSNNEIKEETVEKKKECLGDETPDISVTKKANSETSGNNDTTTSNTVDLTCKKKSKSILSSVNKSLEEPTEIDPRDSRNIIASPVRSKSKKIKNLSLKNTLVDMDMQKDNETSLLKENVNQTETRTETFNAKKPNELQKECIVVIQKKVFKNLIKSGNNASQTNNAQNNMKKDNATSKPSFDSDSDEIPLSYVNKKDNLVEEDDNFIDSGETKLKTDVRSPKSKPKKIKRELTKVKKAIELKPSQSLFDNDDDVFADNKTILIKKTYNKVIKPQKSKSTGSITQKDIDELKARIEAKKKLLLAKSLTPETAELRCLIKKWQKGCQDALIELLELMRHKFPEQNMDYSEMLETLKIPATLVGYDAENDCFISPNDESVILGQFIE